MAILTMIFYYQDYHQQYSQQELALKKLNENKFFLNRWRNFLSKIFAFKKRFSPHMLSAFYLIFNIHQKEVVLNQ